MCASELGSRTKLKNSTSTTEPMSQITRMPQPAPALFGEEKKLDVVVPSVAPQQAPAPAPPVASATSAPASTKSLSSPVCHNCKTHTTPLWRRDDSGQVLCNACGLFLKLHGRPRPISLKTDTIKSRNRIKQSSGLAGNQKSTPNTPELRAKGEKRRSSGNSPKTANGSRKSSAEYPPLIMKQSQPAQFHIAGGVTPGMAPVHHGIPSSVQPLNYPSSVPVSFPQGLERITSPLLLSSATQHDRAAASALETMSSNDLESSVVKRGGPPPQGVSLMASTPSSGPSPSTGSTIFSAVNMAVRNGDGGNNNSGSPPPNGSPLNSSQDGAPPPPQPPNRNETTMLKTRISELELVNDLYKTRIIELEAMEQASKLREDSMRRRLDEMMALANMHGVVPIAGNAPRPGAVPQSFHHAPGPAQYSPPMSNEGSQQEIKQEPSPNGPPTLPSIGTTNLPPPVLPSIRQVSSPPPPGHGGVVLPSLKRSATDEGTDIKKPKLN